LHNKFRKFASAIVLSSLFLAGCSVTAVNEDAEINWVIAGNNLFNGHMDPHSSQLDASAYLNRQIFDSLVTINDEGDIKPWLATEWTVSEDALSYIFKLREDVTFHDGEKFDANAVKVNFDHVTAKTTESAQAASMIGGDSFIGAVVLDEYLVELKLSTPFKPLLVNLSSAFLGLYSPKVLTEKTQGEIRAGGAEVQVGTGPFILKESVTNVELVLERNDDYRWAPDGSGNPPKAKTLRVLFVPDESAREIAISRGDADVASNISGVALASLPSEVQINKTPSPGIPYSVYLNTKRDAFKDVNVRLAFAHGFDAKKAISAAFQGEIEWPLSILSPTTAQSYLETAKGFTYQPELANSLLDDAGWATKDADGYRVDASGKRLSVYWASWTPFPPEHQVIVNFMVDDLKNVGIELVHEALEPAQYQAAYSDANGLKLDFDLTDWSFASLDPIVLSNHLASGGYQNASAVSDAEVDAWLSQAAIEQDPEVRRSLYQKVQEWNEVNAVIVPIYLPQSVVTFRDVTDLVFDSYGWPLFYKASKS